LKPTQEGPTQKPHGDQIQVGWLGHNDGLFYDWADYEAVKANNRGGFSPVYVDQGD
jgi:hypothetical protein